MTLCAYINVYIILFRINGLDCSITSVMSISGWKLNVIMNLPWFDCRDKDYQELQKIILNPELLASFKYYTRFRYKKIVDNLLLF